MIAATFFLPSLALLGGCRGVQSTIVLRVYNWEEYIDEGGEGALIYDELHLTDDDGNPAESDIVNADFKEWYQNAMGIELDNEGPAILDDFCLWYEKEYDQPIRVEYSTFGTNEDMYNEIALGNSYDLLCPSDYMIMKLAAEDYLEKFDESFFDETQKNNYYVRNISPYIREKFANNADLESTQHLWKDYAAGYFWGTTGFVYNPEFVDLEDLQELDWGVFTSEKYRGKITAKDNVRDTYFAALGVTYQNKLMELDRTAADYNKNLTKIFNSTDAQTVAEVKPTLMNIKNNIYSFETDTGKADMVSGKIWMNYAWSGDAVYAMDTAEDPEAGDGMVQLDYFVPEAGSNLWFDGWVMPKGANKQAAQAFVNFLSMPYNAMRNSYYVGYTSAISGENDEMLDYIDYLYGSDEEEEGVVAYDLSYFFLGEHAKDSVLLYADEELATSRQLYAQYPPTEVISRCAVMDYYAEEASVRINELWSQVKAETLDAWAIAVICITVLAIAGFAFFVKFGAKIDFFHTKPKKGYRLVKQEDPNRI